MYEKIHTCAGIHLCTRVCMHTHTQRHTHPSTIYVYVFITFWDHEVFWRRPRLLYLLRLLTGDGMFHCPILNSSHLSICLSIVKCVCGGGDVVWAFVCVWGGGVCILIGCVCVWGGGVGVCGLWLYVCVGVCGGVWVYVCACGVYVWVVWGCLCGWCVCVCGCGCMWCEFVCVGVYMFVWGVFVCGWVYVFVWCVGVCDLWTCGTDSYRKLTLFCTFLLSGWDWVLEHLLFLLPQSLLSLFEKKSTLCSSCVK